MLTIFPRHTDACTEGYKKKHAGALPGRDYRLCKCPLHVEGTLGGKMLRRALKTGNWTVAQARVRDAEATGVWEDQEAAAQAAALPTIVEMASLFIASTKSRGSALRRLTTLLLGCNEAYMAKCAAKRPDSPRVRNLSLAEYAAAKGYTALDQITVPDLTTLASGWRFAPEQYNKRIGGLRRFWKYSIASKWATENPALGLGYDRSGKNAPPQLPFDGASLPQDGPELTAIWAHCAARPGLLALCLLMRYAGLRISDAVRFHRDQIMADGSIFLYAAKTGEPVSCPMHPLVAQALAQLKPNTAGYYFTSGASKLTTATDNWRARLSKMFRAAGIAQGHPHRFRHTFAVDLLLRGIEITQVQALMAHTAIETTQRYLAFVASRRRHINDAVRAAWGLTQPLAPAPAPSPMAPAPNPMAPAPVVVIRRGVAA